MASRCGSTPLSIWSTLWSGRKPNAKAGVSPSNMLRIDMIILDDLGYLPFSQTGGALLFQLLSKLYEPPA